MPGAPRSGWCLHPFKLLWVSYEALTKLVVNCLISLLLGLLASQGYRNRLLSKLRDSWGVTIAAGRPVTSRQQQDRARAGPQAHFGEHRACGWADLREDTMTHPAPGVLADVFSLGAPRGPGMAPVRKIVHAAPKNTPRTNGEYFCVLGTGRKR